MNCELCNFKCGINRSEKTGHCGLDSKIHISYYGLHTGEEPFLTGKHGSGTIFFAGCTLRCRFCQNHQISRWKSSDGTGRIETVSVRRLAAIYYELAEKGASNINLVSPTPYVPGIKESIIEVKSRGFDLPFVYNTHGYDTPETIESLEGVIDIYLPDMKYGDDSLGLKFSGAKNMYTRSRETIRAMFMQSGNIVFNRRGLAIKGVAVRHLVLPGHAENSLQVLDYLETLSSSLSISLMSQYHPINGNYDNLYPELNRTLKPDEYYRIVDYASNLGFKNLLIQEMSSHRNYLPDFNSKKAFRD